MTTSCTVRLPALVFVCTVRFNDSAVVGLFSRTPSPVIGKWLPCIPSVPVARKWAFCMFELSTAARTVAAVTGLGLGTLAKKAPPHAVVRANRPSGTVTKARRTMGDRKLSRGAPDFNSLNGSAAGFELDSHLAGSVFGA